MKNKRERVGRQRGKRLEGGRKEEQKEQPKCPNLISQQK